MDVITLSSWDEFAATVKLGDGKPLDPLFRGQGDASWKIVAPSVRYQLEQAILLKQSGQKYRHDQGQLAAFRRLATGLVEVDVAALPEADLAALARHHGLTSHLVDWSLSPYVAAFFAFTSALDRANGGRLSTGQLSKYPVMPPSKDVCVWRLGVHASLWSEGEFELLSALSPLNRWQKAQNGVFTKLTCERFADVETYLEHRGELGSLTKIVIPGRFAGLALADLELMNISYATLFPDLRGAALQADLGATIKLMGAMPS